MMDNSDADGGISDVMAQSLNLDSPPRRNTRDNADDGHRMENGHGSASGKPSREQQHTEDSVKIDLSDPNQVISLLETVDLNEEDTEVLLQEAYSMNKKLKEMLRRQEQGSKGAKSTNDGNPHSMKSPESASGSRSGSAARASRNPLPPIKKETSIYAVKLKRSRTTVQDASPPRDYSMQRSKTKEVIGISRKPMARAKTTEPRPEWNDRFNFT